MNKDETAFPQSIAVTSAGDVYYSHSMEGCEGLTKREYFAAMMLQGFLATTSVIENPVEFAVNIADDLIRELEVTNETK